MRLLNFGIFVLLVAGIALFIALSQASGEPAGNTEDLDREIERLTKALESVNDKADKAKKTAGRPKTVIRTYNVADLIFVRRNYPGPAIGLTTPRSESAPSLDIVSVQEEYDTLDGHVLGLLIEENIAPDTWDDPKTGASITATRDGLIVRQTPEIQKYIEDYLNDLRSYMNRSIMVEGTLVELDRVLFERAMREKSESGVYLQDADADDLISKGQILYRAITSCYDRQRVNSTDVTWIHYIRDYDVQIAIQAAICDPIPDAVADGVVFDVTPTADDAGERIILDIRFTTSDLPAKFRTVKMEIGEVDFPKQDVIRFRTSVSLFTGQTAVCGAVTTEKGAPAALFVRAAFKQKSRVERPGGAK